jgi:hypothetical protein
MNNISTELPSQKTGIVFLSGSAGELDWILPIIDDLLKKDFNFKIIFLTRHARLSVKGNQLLNDYIQSNHQVEIFLCGGYFIEKMEHFSYLIHRASIKFKLSQKPLFKLFIVF